MASKLPIPANGATDEGQNLASSFVTSFRSSSPLAQELVARDLAQCLDREDDGDAVDEAPCDSESEGESPTLYRRPSGVAYGSARPTLGPNALHEPILTQEERSRSHDAERSLLRDNHILPPKHAAGGKKSYFSELYGRIFSPRSPPRASDEESPTGRGGGLTETSPLLGPDRPGATPGHEHLNEQWEAAVAEGRIRTTWQREAKTIAVYSRSLIVTFLLQYSINVASIFAVGQIGKLELGAVSLATMTANITGYALFQGLSTSLDTLCAQAYGSGHKHLVGLQLQRMTFFLWLLFIPVAVLWFYAGPVLALVVPERRSADLAGLYLRIMILGAPAMIAFEGGKRFVQAQGLFQATTYVLLAAAPANILMNYLFVWKFGWGYVGAPVAVVVTQNMLPLLLLLYIWRIDGSQCWGGLSRRALTNWGPMIRLALPGMVMVVAEWFAFEILTLTSGRFGTSYLAAQSVLITVATTTYQIPFPMSIAGSTRVANLIGAKLVDAAKTSARVTFVGGLIIGLFNLTIVAAFRYKIPLLFNRDPEVVELVAQTLPICAFMQLFDGLAAVSNGLLRGIGRQEIGGYVNLAIYYLVALPVSFGLGFGLHWKLKGLWTGVTLGLFLAVREAEQRNAAG